MANKIQLRRDLAANWTTVNPTLSQGEIAFELDTGLIKIGDGTTAWNSLNYFSADITDFTAIADDLIPDEDDVRSIGSPDKKWKELYVSEGSIYIGDVKLTNVAGKLTVTQVLNPGEENETPVEGGGDAYQLPTASGTVLGGIKIGTTLSIDESGVVESNVLGSLSVENENELISSSFLSIVTNNGDITITSEDDVYIEANDDIALRSASQDVSITVNYELENQKTWSFNTNGNLVLPQGGDIKDSEGNSVLGSGEVPTSFPYLELTNSAFILQPVVLGSPTTFTAPPQGSGSVFEVTIGNDSIIESVVVVTPGTGYSANQIYKIPYFAIGGSDDNSSILFTVASINEEGGILTISDIAYVGIGTNSSGNYLGISGVDYQPSFFDEIDTGLTLTRDNVRGLFNSESETEYNNTTYVSPAGTEWNSDGWGDLIGFGSRNYSNLRSVLNNAIGNNIIGSELIMHDTINDQYYKFEFTIWGENNGAFAYTRTPITDPNYFKKTDDGSEVDIFVADDGEGAGIGITRGSQQSIYNPYREEGYVEETSPAGTLWNLDGWVDLSDIETRTYTNFYNLYNGQLGNRVPGSETVMYIQETDTYYAIKWLSWTQNANGGGFSYLRYEIDLNQIQEGIRFSDGTLLKSAEGVGRIKSTASGGRRIEEVSGSDTVTVTEIVTTDLSTTASRAVVDSGVIWVEVSLTTIDEILEDPESYGIYDYNSIEFSIDNVNWYQYTGSISYVGTERGYTTTGNFTYNQGDTVYFRYDTGGEPQIWWNKNNLPNGSANFRGAVIDYHAYTGEGTIIGTIHIVDDSGEEHISHTEVASGSTDSENDDLWLVQNEGTISYRRIDGESKTLKIHWTAKVFYGTEYYD